MLARCLFRLKNVPAAASLRMLTNTASERVRALIKKIGHMELAEQVHVNALQ